MIALIISLLIPAIAGFLNWYAHDTYSVPYWFREGGVYSDMAGVGEPIYIVIAVASCALLPLGVILKRIDVLNALGRILIFVGIVISVYWIAIPLLVLGDQIEYTHANPEEIALSSIAVLVGAAIVSVIYVLVVSRRR